MDTEYCTDNTMDIEKKKIVIEFNVEMETKDGQILRANVYRPDDDVAHPTILIREPYSKDLRPDWGFMSPHLYARDGFSVVLQDVRGSGVSDGTPMFDPGETEDGLETIDWVAKQPWCNGKISMIGLSYYGGTQVQVAQRRPEHLVACAPFMPMGYYFRHSIQLTAPKWFYNQFISAMRLGKFPYDKELLQKMDALMSDSSAVYDLPEYDSRLLTGLPEIPNIGKEGRERIDNLNNELFWHENGWEVDVENFDVPCLFGTGWYDGEKPYTLELYGRAKKAKSEKTRENVRLIVGPWCHGFTMTRRLNGVDFGPFASWDMFGLYEKVRDWNLHWATGADTPYMHEAPVQVFLMGINEWRGYSEWPPKEAELVPYYIGSNGHANSRMGDGILSLKLEGAAESDSYDYDPQDPTPGNEMLHFIEKDEERRDTLVYTTSALTEPVNVTGMVTMKLFAKTDARDTDFFCRIADVFPDGRTLFLASGLVRARYRLAERQPNFIEPNIVYEYEINIGGISNLFLAGHNIRVDICSSSFPEYDRNHNTTDPIGKGRDTVVAHQTILHSEEYPSHLLLPVISR